MDEGWSVRALLGSLARDVRARLREEQAWGETHAPLEDPSTPRRPLPAIPALEPGPRAVPDGRGRSAASGSPAPSPAGPRPPGDPSRRPGPPPAQQGQHTGAPPWAAPPGPAAGPPPSAPPSHPAAAHTPGPQQPAAQMVDVPPGAEGLALVRERLGDCSRCRLCQGRSSIVFGEGNPDADLLFIGEGPGFHEDKQGRPFVGPAGQLLDRMIAAMGFARTDVYIANIVKCRPPENRDPEPDEQAACRPFVDGQIQAIRPQVIVTLGRISSQSLLRSDIGVSRLRGTFRPHPESGIPVMATYHPAALLRNDRLKRPTWEDLKQVMERLGRPPRG